MTRCWTRYARDGVGLMGPSPAAHTSRPRDLTHGDRTGLRRATPWGSHRHARPVISEHPPFFEYVRRMEAFVVVVTVCVAAYAVWIWNRPLR
jgi:hypothetical protein